MNFKKGVSAMSLVIVIVILGIITSTVVITGSNMVAKAELKKFGTEMLQVKEAVDRYKIRKNGNLDFTIANIYLYTPEETSQFSGEIINGNYVELYVVDLTKIDVENVNYGSGNAQNKDRYLWSETTGRIYYERGFRYKKTTVYYTLTDELMELIK